MADARETMITDEEREFLYLCLKTRSIEGYKKRTFQEKLLKKLKGILFHDGKNNYKYL